MKCKIERRRGIKAYTDRVCGDKIQHHSYYAAWEVAQRLHLHDDENMVPYRCPICYWFHIGHQRHENDLSTAFVPLSGGRPKKRKRIVAVLMDVHSEPKRHPLHSRYTWQRALDDGWPPVNEEGWCQVSACSRQNDGILR